MLPERIASLDDIPAGLREHYQASEDGNGFELQIQGAGPLRRVLAIERQAQRNLQGRVRELEEQVRTGRVEPPKREELTPRERFLEQAAGRLSGLEGEARATELAKIEQEIEPLIACERAEIEQASRARVEGMRRTIQRLTRESAAAEIITRIRRPGVSADLLMPTVLARIETEERDGDFAAIAKNAQGQPMSLEAFAEELRATPALAPLIAGASQDEKAAHALKVSETLGNSQVRR